MGVAVYESYPHQFDGVNSQTGYVRYFRDRVAMILCEVSATQKI